MAGIVADYKIITDDSFRLGVDIDKTLEFGLPRSVKEDQAAIVSFMLTNESGLRLRIEINGTEVAERRHAEGTSRVIQQIVGPVAKRGRNRITFTVNSVSAERGDVVLWFQRG
jgi:hypothetical protein